MELHAQILGNYFGGFSRAFIRNDEQHFPTSLFQDEICEKLLTDPVTDFHERNGCADLFQLELAWDPIGDKISENKSSWPILSNFDLRMRSCCIGICRSELGIRLSNCGISETGIRNLASWTRKWKSKGRNLEIGIWDLGKVKIEKLENRKMKSGVKIMRIGISERKIRNRNLDRKSGNRFLVKTDENLRNRQKVTHEKNYFQKDDQTGYKSRNIIFKTNLIPGSSQNKSFQ